MIEKIDLNRILRSYFLSEREYWESRADATGGFTIEEFTNEWNRLLEEVKIRG